MKKKRLANCSTGCSNPIIICTEEIDFDFVDMKSVFLSEIVKIYGDSVVVSTTRYTYC